MIFRHRAEGSSNAIVTLSVGANYFDEWQRFSETNWLRYCKKWNINLVVFTEPLIDTSSKYFKKIVWHKFLLGREFKVNAPFIDNIVFMDNDILISPFAPNIFNELDLNKVNVVSQEKNLPFDLVETRRSIAFNRNRFFSRDYPLDSSLFMTPKDIYMYHGYEPFEDYFCSGLFSFNVQLHSDIFEEWFYEFDGSYRSITDGEEPHFNYLVSSREIYTVLPYRYQAIWLFEMASRYRHLYEPQNRTKTEAVVDAVSSCLLSNYFLHFAGSWHESAMWKIAALSEKLNDPVLDDYGRYLAEEVTGSPKGIKRHVDKGQRG